MKDSKGGWTMPPPPYDCIATEESSNNIDEFISMEPDRGWGTVLDLSHFVNFFVSYKTSSTQTDYNHKDLD